MTAQKRGDCHFCGVRSVRETLIQFVSQIFENNDLAFFEAAIDTLPVPQPISANVSLLLIWSFSNAIELSSISVRGRLTIS